MKVPFPTASFLSEMARTDLEQQVAAWSNSPVSHGSFLDHICLEAELGQTHIANNKLFYRNASTYTALSVNRVFACAWAHMGPVIGGLINICAERPRQEKTVRRAFNTNASGLRTKNNSGTELADMLHVCISGGPGEIMMMHRRKQSNIM